MISHELSATDLRALRANKIFLTTHSGTERFHEGDRINFEPGCVIEPYTAIFSGHDVPSMGSFSYSWSPLFAAAQIGRYCSISWGLIMIGPNHSTTYVSTSAFTFAESHVPFPPALGDAGSPVFLYHEQPATRPGRDHPPRVGHDVWIGQDVALARGIELGLGSIVAARSVVTKSVPPYAIVGGNPAKLIRMRFPDRIIEKLMASEWWNYSFPDFGIMPYNDPERFVDELADKVAQRQIKPMALNPKRLEDILGAGDQAREPDGERF